MNLKKIIKEEDDWSWTQSEPNMWLSYQMLIFDEIPTKEEIIKFINYAFKSGLVKNEAIRAWELEGIADEAQNIYEYAQEGSPYLRIDLNKGWLYYGSDYKDIVDPYPELTKINFSEAKKYSINESDFDWIEDTNLELTICEAIDYLPVGETVNVSNIYDWRNPDIIYNNITGEILEINNCNKIMKDNNSKDPTILIHFKEKYGGFTQSWYKHLDLETSKEICSDGRCMFLICGEDGERQEGVRITPLPKNLQESEEDDWAWAKEPFDIPRTKEELEYFIGWSFLWDESGKKTGMWGYDGRLWEIIEISGKNVFYKDSETGKYNDTDVRTFLRSLNDGSWVLVSPEGDIFDPMYNRTYSKKINESDEDFKWIEDVDPKDMTFRIGDIIKVHNVGDEVSFLRWLGDYSDNFIDNMYGEFIIGEIVGLDDKRIELQERYTDDYIYFPTYLDMENVRNGGGGFGRVTYEGLDMYYEILGDGN